MNYYKDIKKLIEENIINSQVYQLKVNNDILYTYFNIGRLLIEAQGGKNKTKYGDQLIEEYSKKLTYEYGKGYTARELRKMRKFYSTFEKWGSVSPELSWTHYRYLISINDNKKREYYIKLVINNHLSVRKMQEEIKNKSTEVKLIKK